MTYDLPLERIFICHAYGIGDQIITQSQRNVGRVMSISYTSKDAVCPLLLVPDPNSYYIQAGKTT